MDVVIPVKSILLTVYSDTNSIFVFIFDKLTLVMSKVHFNVCLIGLREKKTMHKLSVFRVLQNRLRWHGKFIK